MGEVRVVEWERKWYSRFEQQQNERERLKEGRDEGAHSDLYITSISAEKENKHMACALHNLLHTISLQPVISSAAGVRFGCIDARLGFFSSLACRSSSVEEVDVCC